MIATTALVAIYLSIYDLSILLFSVTNKCHPGDITRYLFFFSYLTEWQNGNKFTHRGRAMSDLNSIINTVHNFSYNFIAQ